VVSGIRYVLGSIELAGMPTIAVDRNGKALLCMDISAISIDNLVDTLVAIDLRHAAIRRN